MITHHEGFDGLTNIQFFKFSDRWTYFDANLSVTGSIVTQIANQLLYAS